MTCGPSRSSGSAAGTAVAGPVDLFAPGVGGHNELIHSGPPGIQGSVHGDGIQAHDAVQRFVPRERKGPGGRNARPQTSEGPGAYAGDYRIDLSPGYTGICEQFLDARCQHLGVGPGVLGGEGRKRFSLTG